MATIAVGLSKWRSKGKENPITLIAVGMGLGILAMATVARLWMLYHPYI